MYTSVCMLCMICMILMGLLWSRVMIATRSVRMRVLHQPLADLSIGCLEISPFDIRASDIVPLIDDQAKGWRLWPDDWDKDSWMMNYCLLVVHFSAPRTLLLTLMFQWSFSVFECRHIIYLQITPWAILLPPMSDDFLPSVFLKD